MNSPTVADPGNVSGFNRAWKTAGPDKAASVAAALSGDESLPAARVAGTVRTLWLLDTAAASKR